MRIRYLSVQLLQRNAERGSESGGTEVRRESLHRRNQTDAANLPTPDESVWGAFGNRGGCWPHCRAPAPGAAQVLKMLWYSWSWSVTLHNTPLWSVFESGHLDARQMQVSVSVSKLLQSTKQFQQKYNKKQKHNNKDSRKQLHFFSFSFFLFAFGSCLNYLYKY